MSEDEFLNGNASPVVSDSDSDASSDSDIIAQPKSKRKGTSSGKKNAKKRKTEEGSVCRYSCISSEFLLWLSRLFLLKMKLLKAKMEEIPRVKMKMKRGTRTINWMDL